MHACESGHGSRAAYNEHQANEDVRYESEDHEDEMGNSAISRLDAVPGIYQSPDLILDDYTRINTYTSRKVCALGALLFNSIARVAKRRIWTVAPDAYQNGPETPYL